MNHDEAHFAALVALAPYDLHGEALERAEKALIQGASDSFFTSDRQRVTIKNGAVSVGPIDPVHSFS